MAFTVDGRKLRKVLEELIAEMDAMESPPVKPGGHIKGIGISIGRVGSYWIGLEIDLFDSNDFVVHTPVVTEKEPTP